MRTRPTIRDVARTAECAVGTVSRVINRDRSVSARMRERVYGVMKDLGYTPNAVAQSLRTKATLAVAFMIPDISNPLFGTMAKHAQEVLHRAGYSLVLANTSGQPEQEVELMRLFRQRQIDALIMSVGTEDNPALLEAISDMNVPVVLLDRELPIETDRVMTEHVGGMFRATQYLHGLGHRRIALITPGEDISPGRARLAGFRKGHVAANRELDEALVRSGSLSEEYGFHEAQALFSLAIPPTALIAGGNQILMGVLRALELSQLRVPEDLSLISCDDTALTRLARPPITVIYRDVAAVGRNAAEILVDRLSDAEVHEPRCIVLPTELMLRQSCAPPLKKNGRAPDRRTTESDARLL